MLCVYPYDERTSVDTTACKHEADIANVVRHILLQLNAGPQLRMQL